jgi:hypothetical protein
MQINWLDFLPLPVVIAALMLVALQAPVRTRIAAASGSLIAGAAFGLAASQVERLGLPSWVAWASALLAIGLIAATGKLKQRNSG